ncbi:ABC transporter substrate-binding protein [Hansschlegelia quercus]|uniref:ABC transporter substrate-binding protein n=1 Tax=Hansschlegelia quercus TaxID=2528245 RepID=A0A4V2JE52_9HYPH|nr:ABC transporter substrate-binding protein [Hansschlegelia quercus]TBN53896.1 ABC transporter substrate-binding protein [Hansschlegelia quercus]
MRSFRKFIGAAALALAAFAAPASSTLAAEPLKVGYSDWPGWVAWQVAIDKGWFKEAGVDVQFEWFDYSASMEAFGAGKIDAVTVTNGDTLVMGSSGSKGVMVMLTDYSNGNDMIIGKSGVKKLADLKGKKIGLESGLVEHLLLLNGLKKANMKDTDVEIVNVKTNDTPQVLGDAAISAVGAWQPVAGQAMKGSPGARPLYTSADQPGLIYDVVTVSPTSFASRKDDWAKMLKVWDRVVAYIDDPKTQPDAVKIMAARSGVPPEEYVRYLKGTKLLSAVEGAKVFKDAEGFGSLYGSSRYADDFNVKAGVYKDAQDVKAYIDPSIAAK